MDENSVSFQMFFKILLSFITLGSENQISVFKECQSNTLRCPVIWGGGGWGVGMGACADAKIWRNFSVKEKTS